MLTVGGHLRPNLHQTNNAPLSLSLGCFKLTLTHIQPFNLIFKKRSHSTFHPLNHFENGQLNPRLSLNRLLHFCIIWESSYSYLDSARLWSFWLTFLVHSAYEQIASCRFYIHTAIRNLNCVTMQIHVNICFCTFYLKSTLPCLPLVENCQWMHPEAHIRFSLII